MSWRGPQHDNDFPSLGWDLLDWLEVLPSPRDPSESLRFTDEQALQIVEWFRVDPVSGEFVFRRGYSRRSKGWGKSPVEAAKVIAELAGPVRFAGWDADGEPVGRPWGGPGDPQPWVQVGAVSEDQTDNTWSVVYYFLTENDGSAADELRIDPGLTRCFLRDRPGAKLEPVTASAGSREGQPITYACLDETHLWTPRNGGVKLARTLRRNAAKMGGRTYETTNSFERGEQSVAERSYKAVQNGSPGIFADEVEAPTEVDGEPVDVDASDKVLRTALGVAYGGATWVDRERLIAEIRDPDTPWRDAARFFLNWNQDQARDTDAGPIDLDRWASLARVNVEYDRDTVSLACAVAYDRSWTSIVAVGTSPDGFAQAKVVAMQPGTTWAPPRLVELSKELGGVSVAMVKDEPLSDDLEALGVTVASIGGADQARSSQKLIDACSGDAPTLRHRGEPALAKALEIAVTKPYGDGNTDFSSRLSPGDISPLKALTLAFGRLGNTDGAEPFFMY